MKEKRAETMVAVTFRREEKARLAELAKREQRSLSNMAALLLREALDKRMAA